MDLLLGAAAFTNFCPGCSFFPLPLFPYVAAVLPIYFFETLTHVDGPFCPLGETVGLEGHGMGTIAFPPLG